MFFIGIFGTNHAQKPIGTRGNIICPSCGSLTHSEVFKAYSYFHVFFIPTFRWNTRYYTRFNCCGKVYGLEPDIGRQFEKGLTLKSGMNICIRFTMICHIEHAPAAVPGPIRAIVFARIAETDCNGEGRTLF